MPQSFFTTCIKLPTWIAISPYLMAISSHGYFTQFKVPLDLKECSTQPIPIISANSLKTLCFYETESRAWQHVHDLIFSTYFSLVLSFLGFQLLFYDFLRFHMCTRHLFLPPLILMKINGGNCPCMYSVANVMYWSTYLMMTNDGKRYGKLYGYDDNGKHSGWLMVSLAMVKSFWLIDDINLIFWLIDDINHSGVIPYCLNGIITSKGE